MLCSFASLSLLRSAISTFLTASSFFVFSLDLLTAALLFSFLCWSPVYGGLEEYPEDGEHAAEECHCPGVQGAGAPGEEGAGAGGHCAAGGDPQVLPAQLNVFPSMVEEEEAFQ